MIAPITFDDLSNAFSRSPSKSSPGMDGLPYELVRLIFIHPDCCEIALATYKNALSFSDIPPKRPPLDSLKNWRPISLINTDAKVFTRILSARMVSTASSLITSYQTGFVRGRFIDDNGLLIKMVMEHARTSKSSSIGLLLDQEKAYDRVHPVYLHAVLLRFGYPLQLVDCIGHLFFDTKLVTNVNGFLSKSISQNLGLKQGDPISPILFNLAFEPLLRSILQDPHLLGFSLPTSVSSEVSLQTLSPVKIMINADDVVCLLNSPPELSRLQELLLVHSSASNALVNFHKTETISLLGASGIYNTIWQSPLLQYNITSWHDCRSASPVVYLGFPLFSALAQRDSFLNQILNKIRSSCLIHQQRGLSVRGCAMVLNSLNTKQTLVCLTGCLRSSIILPINSVNDLKIY